MHPAMDMTPIGQLLLECLVIMVLWYQPVLAIKARRRNRSKRLVKRAYWSPVPLACAVLEYTSTAVFSTNSGTLLPFLLGVRETNE